MMEHHVTVNFTYQIWQRPIVKQEQFFYGGFWQTKNDFRKPW
jgi:hypothetical protein